MKIATPFAASSNMDGNATDATYILCIILDTTLAYRDDDVASTASAATFNAASTASEAESEAPPPKNGKLGNSNAGLSHSPDSNFLSMKLSFNDPRARPPTPYNA